MDPMEKKEPTEPIEQADPMEPMERMDPFDPMERTEFSDLNDHFGGCRAGLVVPTCRNPSGHERASRQVAAVAAKSARYTSCIWT